MRRLLRYWPISALIIAGFASQYPLSEWLVSAIVALGWRRPVQQWMISHGLGAWAGTFGMVYILIPSIGINLVTGAACGLLGGRRWLPWCLTFSVSYFLFPYLLTLVRGQLVDFLTAWGASTVIETALWQASIILIAVVAGWVTSRVRRGRAPPPAHACSACDYDLTGNVSGVCPERGSVIGPAQQSFIPL